MFVWSSCNNGYTILTHLTQELLQRLSKSAGAFDAVICNHWAKGGEKGWHVHVTHQLSILL